ncbi:hypothetical protein PPL_07615 [Heterostelium album PN500]|uniref:Uncharacterized protein n=1 Tax=Heterostelium pallidum (strain ATCC 26659 / Pp 5 / PN500) TaxID=670386 RepID=D3BGG4_HETP5|nr:hypothetical protein PPL_07615 [Heterostelium album PN500]EFA79564.1 hypothetical protein PPL_07615 [Heterostelium album PN500]|eukprot:XP_020431685.1 hypothetical protein PPL_07615 [Heterostelium album PN500]
MKSNIYFTLLVVLSLTMAAVSLVQSASLEAGTYAGSIYNCSVNSSTAIGYYSFYVEPNNTIGSNGVNNGTVSANTTLVFSPSNYTLTNNAISSPTIGCWTYTVSNTSVWTIYFPFDNNATCTSTCTNVYANLTFTPAQTNSDSSNNTNLLSPLTGLIFTIILFITLLL